VTLKTGVIMLEIQLCLTGINYTYNIVHLYVFTYFFSQYNFIFDQINAPVASITDFF